MRQDREINHLWNPWTEVEMHLQNLVTTKIDTEKGSGNLAEGKATGIENVIVAPREVKMDTVLDINFNIGILNIFFSICMIVHSTCTSYYKNNQFVCRNVAMNISFIM